MNNNIDIIDLQAFFNSLSSIDQRKVFITSFKKASKPILSEVKSTVPYRTGTLSKSIGFITVPNETAILIGAKKSSGGWYGHLIENGTLNRIRRSKNDASTGKVIGIHFMEKAYNNNESYMINTIEEEWYNAINNMVIKFNNKK